MENIQINEYPVKPVLKLLLVDKSTQQNIVFATNSYTHLGARYGEGCHIDEELLLGMDAMEIQPRVLKNSAEQADRTKKSGGHVIVFLRSVHLWKGILHIKVGHTYLPYHQLTPYSMGRKVEHKVTP